MDNDRSVEICGDLPNTLLMEESMELSLFFQKRMPKRTFFSTVWTGEASNREPIFIPPMQSMRVEVPQRNVSGDGYCIDRGALSAPWDSVMPTRVRGARLPLTANGGWPRIRKKALTKTGGHSMTCRGNRYRSAWRHRPKRHVQWFCWLRLVRAGGISCRVVCRSVLAVRNRCGLPVRGRSPRRGGWRGRCRPL